MAETTITCGMHKASSTPSQGSGSDITHKIGQNVVVATTVLPQGHNLWEKNIDIVNHPWDES